MLTSMPTRYLASTDAHLANATPWLKSAPHNLDACCSLLMHTASAAERTDSGPDHPISYPGRSISSPQTAFNPHTLTALTA